MNTTLSTVVRALCAGLIGILLIFYSSEAITWITIVIGAVFFLTGLVGCATYLVARRHHTQEGLPAPTFPVQALGSVILGAMLALAPDLFIHGLVYAMAAFLILGAFNHFVVLGSATRYARIGLFWWLVPSLILLVGVIAILKPEFIASAPLIVIGWCLVIYAVTDLINLLKINRCRKIYLASHPVEVVEEAVATEIKDEEEKK